MKNFLELKLIDTIYKTQLDEIMGENSDAFYDDLCKKFESSFTEFIENKSNPIESTLKDLHSLKGSSSMLGFECLSQIISDFEVKLSKDKDLDTKKYYQLLSRVKKETYQELQSKFVA